MDQALLLAARLRLAPFSPDAPPADDRSVALPSGEPSPQAIREALDVVLHHQRAGRGDRVWAALRVIEPLLPSLLTRDPGSAGRVLGALATQALLEADVEAFLDRTRRAAESLEAAGDLDEARRERAALGSAYRMLGLWDDAERALRAAIDLPIAALDLARVHLARAQLTEARSLATQARDAFAHESAQAHALEGAAAAWLAAILAASGEAGAALTEAQRAVTQLDATPEGRVLALAALARAHLAAGEISSALDAAERARADIDASTRSLEGEIFARVALADARLAAGDHPGAASALAEARRRVLAEGSRLTDPRVRRAFLEAVPEHRRALASPPS